MQINSIYRTVAFITRKGNILYMLNIFCFQMGNLKFCFFSLSLSFSFLGRCDAQFKFCSQKVCFSTELYPTKKFG